MTKRSPGYEDTPGVPMTVVTQPNGARPFVHPSEAHKHMMVHDFYQGRSYLEAEKRVKALAG